MNRIDRNRILNILLAQGKKLELALVFDLMPPQQVAELPPKNREFAHSLHKVFKREYRGWYGRSAALLQKVAPKKHVEFASYFLANPKLRAVEPLAEPLREWLNGPTPDFYEYEGMSYFKGAAIMSVFFANQLRILEDCEIKHGWDPVQPTLEEAGV